jgi:hypothetical protein
MSPREAARKAEEEPEIALDGFRLALAYEAECTGRPYDVADILKRSLEIPTSEAPTSRIQELEKALALSEAYNREERTVWSLAMRTMGFTNGTYSLADLTQTVERVVKERDEAVETVRGLPDEVFEISCHCDCHANAPVWPGPHCDACK